MPDATSPQGTADDEALSFDQGVNDITDLLADPETDLSEEDQAQADADAGEPDDAEAPVDEDADGAEEGDGSETPAGGKFVSKDAKVRLEDGTVTTVGDLARNNLYQRDYTRKTQELSEEKKTFETQKSQVIEHARTLNEQRNFLLQAAQQFLPKPPDKAMIDTDLFGYQHALVEYQEKMGVIQQLQQHAQANQARWQQEQELARQEAVKLEAQKIVAKMPELAKPDNYAKFWGEAVDTMAEYGFTETDLNEAIDARFYEAIRDLIKYRKARQAAPKVKQDMQAKPKLMPGGKRMDPKSKTSREQIGRAERLRKTGSVNDAVAALMDLDL